MSMHTSDMAIEHAIGTVGIVSLFYIDMDVRMSV